MEWIAIFITVTIFIIILYIVSKKIIIKESTKSTKKNYYDTNTERHSKPIDYPYQKKSLFTPAERSFLGILYQAVNERTKIFGKVRIADVVETKKGLNRSDRQGAFNRISEKHFDFLLCNNEDFTVICAIELNDISHQTKKTKQRDEFIEGVCKATGLPLIQITAKRNYVVNDIKKLLEPHLYLN